MAWGSVAAVAGVAVLVYVYIYFQGGPPAPTPQGSCTERFKDVEKVYRDNFAKGLESGSAFAAYHEGGLVCDLWGGWADPTTGQPWHEDTMTIAFSSTKAVAAFTIALLCDRGLCDYDHLVTKYWPEFGQNGKEAITLGMLLSHQAGLAAIDEKISMEMILNKNEKVSRILAAQKPNWPPGSAVGYHALSFGLYVDQLVRRIDPAHRSLQQVFDQDIAKPYGIDFFIGVPLSEQWRVARYNMQCALGVLWESLMQPAMRNLLFQMTTGNKFINSVITNPAMEETTLNWPHLRAIPQGSYNGYGTARGLARIYSLIVDADHHDSVSPPVLSPRAVAKLHEAQINGIDRVFGLNLTMSYGVMHWPPVGKKQATPIGHPGKGTQLGMGIKDLHLSLAYVTNFPSSWVHTTEEPRVEPLFVALIKAAS